MSASPQVENGYTRIANELLDAVLQFGFSKRQLSVFFAVVRKTYGFNKLEDDMTVTQLAQVSGLARQNVSTALSELEAIGAVSKRDGRYGYVLKINKNYQCWRALKRDVSKQCASKRDGKRLKTMRGASQNDAHKRQLQKTTPKDNPLNPPNGLPKAVDETLWTEFVKHRKALKKPMTDEAAKRLVMKLDRMTGEGFDAALALENTIVNGWLGVFEPRDGESHGTNNSANNAGHGRPQSAQAAYYERRREREAACHE